MLERASLHPAGRCGACATFNAKEGSSIIIIIADLGAQVLSTVNPDNDVRALEGHGVTPSNVRTVQRNSFIGNSLLERQLLTIVPDAALGETGERMIWKGLWRHSIAPKGKDCPVTVIGALLPPTITPAIRCQNRCHGGSVVPTMEHIESQAWIDFRHSLTKNNHHQNHNHHHFHEFTMPSCFAFLHPMDCPVHLSKASNFFWTDPPNMY